MLMNFEIGVPIGATDKHGVPVHIGDTVEFDEREFGGPCRFVIELRDGEIVHPGATGDLRSWCTVLKPACGDVFRRRVEFRFDLNGVEYALAETKLKTIEIYETRKNSQEDDHEEGEIMFRDGIWQWIWGEESFHKNSGAVLIDFLTMNMPPFYQHAEQK